jgi:predicted NBD/HSP70 family sugar kinase
VTILQKKGQRDKRLIEALVYQQGPISRVGIHAETNLRRTTISLLTRQLLSEGKLIEAGPSDNPLGRKQILLELNRKFGFLVGVEFDDERLTAGVMDLQPAVTRVISEPADLSHGKEGLLRQLQSVVPRVVGASRLPWVKLLGIGIADPGLVDTRRGITTSCSTIDFWNDVPLTSTFEKEFKVPVLVESKTRAKAIAEQMLGAGQQDPNMIYLDYGTGIGAGVIMDGKLLYGHNCGAGEVGHTNMVRSGPTCKCGSNGCLEAVAGAGAVENRTRRALSDGVSSQLLAMAQEDPSRITVWLVLEAARAGDKMCWNIVAQIAEEIGVAIANLVNLFNPSLIVFDQRLGVTGDEFLKLISRVVKGNALAGSAAGLALRFATLGREAGLLGLGLQILERRFSTVKGGS